MAQVGDIVVGRIDEIVGNKVSQCSNFTNIYKIIDLVDG